MGPLTHGGPFAEQTVDTVKIGDVAVSRFILGSNPFSGFSHQGPEMSRRMMHYYTTDRIKTLLRQAEGLGITALTARTDHHVMRFLMEYWDQGGKLMWLGQTCPSVGPSRMCVRRALEGGASACHIHGGVMDYLTAQNNVADAVDGVNMIHDAGLPAGVAGHSPRVFEWAEEHLDVDYYMCCYYQPDRRDKSPEHDPGQKERYDARDRQTMADLIARLSKPVIHYKVMAAGRNDPAEAFGFVARHLRPTDAVCVGIYNENHPDMLAEDVRLFEQSLSVVRPRT